MLWTELCLLKIMLKPEVRMDEIWHGGLWEMGLWGIWDGIYEIMKVRPSGWIRVLIRRATNEHVLFLSAM